MKKILSILSISVLLISGSVYASFPVKNTTTTSITEENSSKNIETKSDIKKSDIKKALKETRKQNSSSSVDTEFIITLCLFILLGCFAAHRWYKGKPLEWNILYILTAGGCGIWALVDLINILRKEF